ncbi:hypothetical protein N9L68_00045 [bacterium]|nr:hypothetical protein [bacterium]
MEVAFARSLLSWHPVFSALSVYGGLEGAPQHGLVDDAVAALGIMYVGDADNDGDVDDDDDASNNQFRYQTVIDVVEQYYGDNSENDD